MNDDMEKRIREIRASDVVKRVKEIQASMAESAKPHVDESELSHLRCLIRLAVEFDDYLEHGSVEIATGILNGPLAKYVPDARSASADPSNKYDQRFVCESVRSGVDSFCSLNASYRVLEGASDSVVEWGMTSSKESLNANFTAMFKEFVEEVNFGKKCRLVLDLFKLQIVFAGISYE
jgi:hypothetical protein